MNPRFPLHAVALAASLLCCASAFAQSRAVEATHVTIDLSSIDSDTSGSTSSGILGGGLGVVFPLGNYLGASLGGQYFDSSVRTRDVLEDNSEGGSRPSCGFETLTGTASLFFRRPTLGKIGVSYGAGNLKSSCDGDAIFPLSGDKKASTSNYRAAADYYLGNFTFGAAYMATSIEDGDDLESTTLSASWYPLDSLKVTLSGNDLYSNNTYGLMVEHQPEMLGDGVSVRLGFSTTDASPKTTTIEIGLAYFFGRQVPLKTRDRQYR